jgi:hypothetical protein
LGDQWSVANTITIIQKELASEQIAWRDANQDVEMCMKVAQELKDMVDQLLAQVVPLETQVGVLSGTIMDMSTKLRARALYLE